MVLPSRRPRTVLGCLIIGVLNNGLFLLDVSPFWQQVVVGAVLIAAVYVDQQRRAAALRGGRRTMTGNLLHHLASSRQAAPARELPRTPPAS